MHPRTALRDFDPCQVFLELEGRLKVLAPKKDGQSTVGSPTPIPTKLASDIYLDLKPNVGPLF